MQPLHQNVFSGNQSDRETAERWLEQFQQYVAFRKLDDDTKLHLFKLLLSDHAAAWLKTLTNATQNDFSLLVNAFKIRFATTDLQRWQKAASM